MPVNLVLVHVYSGGKPRCLPISSSETIARLGECRSIDVTFEPIDIWTLRKKREPRVTALDGSVTYDRRNRIRIHVHRPVDWSAFSPKVLRSLSLRVPFLPFAPWKSMSSENRQDLLGCKCRSYEFTGWRENSLDIPVLNTNGPCYETMQKHRAD